MAEQYEKVEGGCFCGAVRYEAEVNLKEAYYCHCRACQKMSGAPAEVGVFVKPGSLHFLKEMPKYFQSSPIGKRGFCPDCGSRLIWMSPDREDWTNVSAGSLDHPENVEPNEHTCVESQLPWYEVTDNLPRKRSEDVEELVEAWAKSGLNHDGRPL
jgi:adenylate cyclase